MNELRPADANSQIVQKERPKCLLIRVDLRLRIGETEGEGERWGGSGEGDRGRATRGRFPVGNGGRLVRMNESRIASEREMGFPLKNNHGSTWRISKSCAMLYFGLVLKFRN